MQARKRLVRRSENTHRLTRHQSEDDISTKFRNTTTASLLVPGPHKTHACDVTNLWHHALKRFHNLGALRVLVVGEEAGDDDDDRQHDTQVHLRRRK